MILKPRDPARGLRSASPGPPGPGLNPTISVAADHLAHQVESEAIDGTVLHGEIQIRFLRLKGIEGLARVPELDDQTMPTPHQMKRNGRVFRQVAAAVPHDVADQFVQHFLKLASKSWVEVITLRTGIHI